MKKQLESSSKTAVMIDDPVFCLHSGDQADQVNHHLPGVLLPFMIFMLLLSYHGCCPVVHTGDDILVWCEIVSDMLKMNSCGDGSNAK